MHDVLQFHPDVYILVLTELFVSRGWDSHLIYLVQSGIDLRYDFLREFVNWANARETDGEPTLSAKFAPFRMPIIRQAILALKAVPNSMAPNSSLSCRRQSRTLTSLNGGLRVFPNCYP